MQFYAYGKGFSMIDITEVDDIGLFEMLKRKTLSLKDGDARIVASTTVSIDGWGERTFDGITTGGKGRRNFLILFTEE